MRNTIIFLHIPRTGGTTFRDILERYYHSRNVIEIKNFINTEKSIESMTKERRSSIHLIKGHLNFGIHKWIDGPYKYITFLRHPIKRTLSTFKYIKNNIIHEDYNFIQTRSLYEYLESGNNLMLDNGMTRLLAGGEYTFNVPFGSVNEKHYEMAINNLDNHFAVTGITERFNESILVLANELNWKSPYYSIANKSNRIDLSIDIDELSTIKKYYHFDMKLYNYANNLLDNKINQIKNFNSKLKRFNYRNKIIGRFFIGTRLRRMSNRIFN